MLQIAFIFLLFIASAWTLVAVETQTALGALRSLPPEEGARLARIDACDGSPNPERWHFLIYDPQAENGYREYVVADGQVVTRREVSQFGSEFQSTDIIGNTFRIDSDRVSRLALRYAVANNLPVVSMNYEMRRGSRSGPVWEVTCFDRENRAVGWLLVSAEDESVVAKTGFSRAPLEEEEAPAPARSAPKGRKTKNPPAPTAVAEKPEDASGVAGKEERSEPVEIRRAEPAEPHPPIQKAFRIFRGLLPFR
jgi:hypothetical protein